MAIDQHYIPAFSIEDVLLDKDTGAPLSGGIVTFFEDNQRTTLKPVYQITGTSPNYTFIQLPNPMILSSIGTFEDALDNPVVPYFLPYDAAGNVDYYYVTVVSSTFVPQFTRESVPFVPSMGGIITASAVYQNELSNPQFATILFGDSSISSPISYQYNFSAGTTNIEIAPDWHLIVTSGGSSSVTLTQETPPGSENVITNPGTALRIQPIGTSTVLLRQRLFGSPNLWGNGFISASFVAQNNVGTSAIITLSYAQSNGSLSATPVPIITQTLGGSSAYTAYPGSVNITTSDSAQFYPGAYIDIFFTIPNGADVTITSVMVASTGTVGVPNIIYDQESNERQIDHLFHYYMPQLVNKPIPSYLVGWDFQLNPCQELWTPVTPVSLGGLTNRSRYIADQTILFSTVDNVMTMTKISGGFQFTTSGDTSFAIVQYLENPVCIEMIRDKLAVYIQGKATVSIPCEINLYWTSDSTLPDLNNPNYKSLVSGVNATAIQSITNGTWNKILRTEDRGDTIFSMLSSATTPSPSYMFNGWDDSENASITTATYFAIVVSFGTLTTTNTVLLESVAVCAGDIATKPAAMTSGDSLFQCQRYYETNYPSNHAVGGLNSINNLTFPMSLAINAPGGTIANLDIFANSFGFQFKVDKSVPPTITLIDEAGATNTGSFYYYFLGAMTGPSPRGAVGTFWATPIIGTKGTQYKVTSATSMQSLPSFAPASISAFIAFNYIADARLGLV